jgi:exonuclease SbcC
MKRLGADERDLHAQAAHSLKKVAKDLEIEVASFEKRRKERDGNQRDLKNKSEKLAEIEGEMGELSAQIEAQNEIARKAVEQTVAVGKQMADLDQKLKAYKDLECELEKKRILKDQNVEAHGKYLGAKPAAAKLEERRLAHDKSTKAAEMMSGRVRDRQAAFDQAKREFDPSAMDLARRQWEAAAENLAAELKGLENARLELERQQARFAEWQTATRECDEALVACGRLDACIDLTEKARRILLKAAPLVAQQICRRIAGRAQQIFNQINTDPAELEWNSERYSLRINPGERRFAMLSGGEQTKLALAMTLAMIQEFCGLKFCVFDEPTYGVDADSRHKLADAIVRLQDMSENKLDQVLLVSHDDSFEGKIENVVVIRKTAAQGSAPMSIV